jgi:hypothetical protein
LRDARDEYVARRSLVAHASESARRGHVRAVGGPEPPGRVGGGGGV